jgi:nucleoside-diphosphate kinase
MMRKMNTHPKKERTFVILKPDTIQRGLTGEVISRFERVGLKITGMKMIMAQEDLCWKHYNKDDEWFQKKGEITIADRKENDMPVEKEAIEYGKDIIRVLINYIIASPVVIMVIEGNAATTVVKKLVGGTEPTTADIGTIRGDLAIDSYQIANVDERGVRNLVHCSDNPEEAEHEISLWFNEDELISYRLVSEAMLYDVNLDGIME